MGGGGWVVVGGGGWVVEDGWWRMGGGGWVVEDGWWRVGANKQKRHNFQSHHQSSEIKAIKTNSQFE